MFTHWVVRSSVEESPDQMWAISGLTRMRALRKAQRVVHEIENAYIEHGAKEYEIGIFENKTSRLVSMTTPLNVISHPNTPFERIVERQQPERVWRDPSSPEP